MSCQPSPRAAGMTNSATGRSTRSTASSCSPATCSHVGGGDPPAPQLAGVELVGVREHPPRQVIGLPGRQTEAGGERAALRPDIAEHGRVREVDRERGVCSAKLLVELARGRGDAGPVKAGVGVGARLPVDERLDRRERQVARVERDAVAAQDRLRVLIGGAPRVAVVGIDGLVAWPA